MKLVLVVALSLIPAAAMADAAPEPADARGVALGSSLEHRDATLLGGDELAASYMPSRTSPLRLSDEIRFGLGEVPPIDHGGGLDSDVRQILALLLGFVPGFGLGHLIAHDKDGFILFLVIDVALYFIWGVVGFLFWSPFHYVGGLLWLVVHIIQALDAYSSAGGEKFLERQRERAIPIASRSGRGDPLTATGLFQFDF
jgi:hypothetical protein